MQFCIQKRKLRFFLVKCIYFFSTTNSIFANTLEKPKLRILIPTPFIGGEGDMGVRLEKAARNIGWDAHAFFFSTQWPLNTPFDFHRICKPFEYQKDNPSYLDEIIRGFQPDLFICLHPRLYAPIKCKIPHYLALTRSHEINITLYGNLSKSFRGF